MADILRGEYYDSISSCRVVDCRYPYEYNGGHIQGAENLYTHEQIQGILTGKSLPEPTGKKDIIVFHCEFSSERGPKM